LTIQKTIYSPDDIKALSKFKVDRVKRFFETTLCHTKGRYAGTKFHLIGWQHDALEKIFGTLKSDGTRQYRTIYIEIPKKNGKSEFASGLALYGLCADDEHGAEVYSAAGDRDQASLVYYPAQYMAERNKSLSRRIKIIESRRRLIYAQTASFYQVLSSETFTKHGLNPHFVIFDELHAQKNRELYDVLVEGTDTAREQQLIIIITTAGVYDKESIGWEVHDYAIQVENGEIDDPTFLPIIYAITDDEDPNDPKVWKRLNPALDWIFEIDKVETHHKQSQHNPAKWNNFLRFRCNKWVGQIDRYLPMEHWDMCVGKKIKKKDLVGMPCFGGLDLASSVDLTAFILVFPPMKGISEKYSVLCRFYVPQDTLKERIRGEVLKYNKWIKQGFLTATNGNRMNWKHIRTDIEADSKLYDIREIAYDRWGAMQIAMDLSENLGIEMVQHGQGFADMSAPTKHLLEMVLAHELVHNNNPVLRWNADNVAVKQDAAENFKPDKKNSRERIDGIVALVMAVGRCLANPDLQSIYESRGIRVIEA